MIAYSPLETAKLSPAAQKALGPGPGRMMASRGMTTIPPLTLPATVLWTIHVLAEPES